MLLPAIALFLAFRPIAYHTVSGKITDDQGNAITSASILVKGTKQAALSAQDGTYQISTPSKNAVLVFSAVGYQTREINVAGKTTINVTLSNSTAQLQEVVVTGYATKRKMDFTASTTVDPSAIYGSRAPG